jgi:hypothetical protein
VAKIAKLFDQPFFSYVDADVLTRTCDEQLDHSEALIASPEFSRRIDAVIKAAKTRLPLTYAAQTLQSFDTYPTYVERANLSTTQRGQHLLHRVRISAA